MVGVYICRRCSIKFRAHSIYFCPFCGEKLRFLGIIIGTTEKTEEKWRRAPKIDYMYMEVEK